MLETNKIILGDCLEVLKEIDDNTIDTIITDPPYGLKFMGKKWDYDVPSIEIWKECLRVLKPGGTALIFAGSRTQHRMACNVEDAGFILKDCILWIYGSGFPKATDISKQLDKGHERKVIGRNPNSRENCDKSNTLYESGTVGKTDHITEPATEEAKQWNGWKSHGLKPAYEPILLATKPNNGTYAENALKWGVSGLNIDGGRIGTEERTYSINGAITSGNFGNGANQPAKERKNNTVQGRFPANVIFECICDEVIIAPTEAKEPEEVKGGIWQKSEGKPAGRTYKGGSQIHTNPECPCYMLDEQSGELKSGAMNSLAKAKQYNVYGKMYERKVISQSSKGGASRFFYTAKASKSERNAGCEGLEEKQTGSFDGNADTNNTNRKIGANPSKPNQPRQNSHPTVKPLKLMEYLCKLTKTPTGGIVLDPFAGSCTTAVACINIKRDFICIEKEKEYCDIGQARINHALEKKQ